MSHSSELDEFVVNVYDDAADLDTRLKQIREYCLTLMELRLEDSQRLDTIAGRIKKIEQRTKKGGT